MSSTPLLLVISLFILVPVGCTQRPGDRAAQGDVERDSELDEPGDGIESSGTRLRGHVVLGHEVRTFQPCREDTELWVIPDPELRSAYDALSHEPYGPVFVEFRGELGPRPATGFGKEYAGQVTVLAVMRAQPATEGHGCAEDLAGIAFKAAGNEPFWHVRVTREAMVFSTPGAPDLEFPPTAPVRNERGWVYETEAKASDPRSIRFTVERGPLTLPRFSRRPR